LEFKSEFLFSLKNIFCISKIKNRKSAMLFWFFYLLQQDLREKFIATPKCMSALCRLGNDMRY